MKPQKLSFEKKILVFFFLTLILISVIVFLSIRINTETKSTRNWVSLTEKVLSLADSLQNDEQEVVIQSRSFILTANENYLLSYTATNASLQRNLARLRQFTRENRWQQKKVDSLQAIYMGYLPIRQQAINLRRQKNFQLADVVQLIYKADTVLAQLRDIFHSLKSEQKQLLNDRKAAYQKNVEFSAWVVRILLLLFVFAILLAFYLVYRNSVNRRKAELALRKSEELVKSIIHYAPILVNVKDRSGKYILANQQFATAIQADAEHMIGKTCEGIIPPAIEALVNKEDNEVIKHGQPVELMIDLDAPGGKHTFLTSKFPLYDDKGSLYAIGTTAIDITPLKTSHEALLKSFENQQKILDGLQQALRTSLDLLCIIDGNGEFIMLSDTVRQLLGYAPKELMHKKFMDFVVESDRSQTAVIARQIMDGEPVADFTNHYRKKDGSIIPIIWSATWSAEDKLMYCIARNGSERVKTARQLAQSETRLLHAQKIARLGNWDWDLRNNTWSCSDEIYHLFGVAKETITNTQQFLLDSIHPEDKQQLVNARESLLAKGGKIDIEHRIITANGAILFVHTKGEVSLDNEGHPFWFSGTMQDITERKRSELQMKQLNSDLEKRAEELKASNAELERFAYVASHDLQEPLRMVTSFLALLQKKHQNEFDETSKKYIHFAVDGAERMKGLIQDLLHYSRVGASAEAFGTVDLNVLIKELQTVFAPALRENMGILNVQPLPVVSGHKMQLHQLFQNLIGNALKYRSSQNPFIEVGCTDEKEYWRFFVKDNGIGIDQRYFDKIFIIFQRLHTRTDYSGTGIGLAICKKIVERHGGKIWVKSEPGQGSTFYFTLKKSHNA
ncbi:PAS domain S-box protein [Flavisolibacter nicotianae]|uniref:PAS domain S-box protein n=1 Tax=Flavisolibacter nicotianae TaxID=2364882 RepID=UPI000EADF155|nr:PAS domain S-box protein [Flavisolibacter nicotianae]